MHSQVPAQVLLVQVLRVLVLQGVAQQQREWTPRCRRTKQCPAQGQGRGEVSTLQWVQVVLLAQEQVVAQGVHRTYHH